ncbi:hypothetical protein C1646_669894 [Rhizophagus diaphanus]|nr:hypothetical protein C1646_669894 [Rhizophagus diaphanus] [Rhizophagus sp. MUCL 43196]
MELSYPGISALSNSSANKNNLKNSYTNKQEAKFLSKKKILLFVNTKYFYHSTAENWKDWSQESKAEIKSKKKVVDTRNAISKIELAEKDMGLAERDLRIRKASAMVCKFKLVNRKLHKRPICKTTVPMHVDLVEKRIALWERNLKLSKSKAEVEELELENEIVLRSFTG